MSKSEGSAKASELPTTAAAVPTTVTDSNSNTSTAAAHSAAVANVSGVVAPAAAPVPPPAVMTYNMCVRMRILDNTNIVRDLANLIVEYLGFSGEERLTVRGHTGAIRCVAVFPNGCFCSGSNDNSIKIWNRDGQCLQTLNGKETYIYILYCDLIFLF